MMELDFNELVCSDVKRCVAVEPGEDGEAVLFLRGEQGDVEEVRRSYRPWLLLDSAELAYALSVPHEDVPLAGSGRYRVRASFANMADYDAAVKELKLLTGMTPGRGNAPYRVVSDKTQQFLTMCPMRLFAGMRFEELRRLQLDIETRSSGDVPHFPDPKIPGDEIILVSLKDSTGFETCLVNTGDERKLLVELVQTIRARDPDVIEGHNIFQFDLSYIKARCAYRKVNFAIGRDGSAPKTRASRLTCGERIIPYTRFDIYGRHVVDTLHLVELYDIIHRDMDGHGLKAAAKYFHVASPERTYVPGDQITRVFEEDPERLKDYCLDDARETDAISRILSPSYFYQTCLIPYSYQSVVTRGNATRIDAMLCAEYLRNDAALPVASMPQMIQGALTEGDKQGVFQNVWHVDVRSLYPSIIAARNMTPYRDERGEFLRLLTGLRRFRLAAKDARKNAPPALRGYYDALQSTFKILINSFYGYTAFAQGTFNDYQMAAEITSTGRRILAGMQQFLEESGAVVIEMDTDGIYFQPPPDEKAPEDMQRRIQAILPEGIEVEMDAVYRAMFGYKSKNYALLHEDGTVTMSGAALKSRGLEPFQRRYIREIVTLLLTGHAGELDALYGRYVRDIEEHRLPLADFAQKENLSVDPKVYAAKVSSGEAKRSAAYDLAIASGRLFRQGDSVEFYVTGNKKTVPVVGNSRLLSENMEGVRDENVPYYLAKLSQLHKKFAMGS